MNLVKTLTYTIQALESSNLSYALAGGLVANLYRSEPRLTSDIDFAVLADVSMLNEFEVILKDLNLKFGQVKAGDLKKIPFPRKKAKTPIQILIGRNTNNASSVGIDLLLNTIPWVGEAVARAKFNKIKIYNTDCPCLTIEDLLLSKLYSINNYVRYKDLDDVEELLKKQNSFDMAYLIGRMLAYKLTIPREIRQRIRIDADLGKVAREIEKM